MSSEIANDNRSLVEYKAAIEVSNVNDYGTLSKMSKTLGKRKAAVPPLESKPDIESILNAILPPREWEQDGKHFIQYVSHQETSRDEIGNLQKQLDQKLLARQAR